MVKTQFQNPCVAILVEEVSTLNQLLTRQSAAGYVRLVQVLMTLVKDLNVYGVSVATFQMREKLSVF